MTAAARDLFITANRLRLHLLEWGGGDRVVLLLHGFLEHAHGWDFLAPRLADAGLHVFALDWRGHGDSDWVGPGGYYHFFDYVADLSFLVPQLAERVALVGHSMGGGAAVLYAGTEPERVWALASIEGLGMPDSDPATVPQRVVDWLDDLRRVDSRPRSVASVEGAAQRLSQRWPTLPPQAAYHLARHNTCDAGGVSRWKFDPLHQSRSPQPAYVAQARAFWRRVSCPVLYVEGGASTLRLAAEDVDERVAALRAARVTIANAGHHPQLEQPAALAEVLIAFFDSARAPGHVM
jgi:pimeloyl-ACP methyl ester carboxylesterase